MAEKNRSCSRVVGLIFVFCLFLFFDCLGILFWLFFFLAKDSDEDGLRIKVPPSAPSELVKNYNFFEINQD